MKHPNQATLALHAGGDLGFFARWRTNRHLAHCEECRDEFVEFESLREILPELKEIPEVPWNRLAAEMKANIRLGLEAGECVRSGEPPLREHPLFTGTRAAVALASVMTLLVTGLMLERPAPAPVDEGSVVQATSNGIQVRRGTRAMRIMNSGAQHVIYSPDAQGGMRARYVDPKTDYVTINKVYAE
jgi:hypothetical protein